MGNLSVCPSIVIFHIFNFIEVFSRPSKAFFLYHGVRRRINVWFFCCCQDSDIHETMQHMQKRYCYLTGSISKIKVKQFIWTPIWEELHFKRHLFLHLINALTTTCLGTKSIYAKLYSIDKTVIHDCLWIASIFDHQK